MRTKTKEKMIKDTNKIAQFIPNTQGMGLSSFKSNDKDIIIDGKPLYAICVDGNLTISSFRPEITIYNMRNKVLLIISNRLNAIRSMSDYVSIEKDANGNIGPKLIPFHNDDNGIYLKSEAEGNVKVYFTTNLGDIPVLKQNLKKETVIVAAEIIL